MSGLTFSGVSKRFGKSLVLDDVDLKIESGEFVAVLGPSGCGKTTLLRLAAGFETPNGGEIHIGERQVAGQGRLVPPEERNIGIVFQSYALWPHMSVAQNVGYALKVAGLGRAERDQKVAAALATVNLTPYADRRPADLSGGQRQRVALARCLAAGSDLVLLDEPLANLDVHLRATMEEEFQHFHRDTGATMLYITHDQAEAMALADRIAVMDKGRMLQCDTPEALYRTPKNAMVAAFIGNGIILPAEQIMPLGHGFASAQIFGAQLRLRCTARQAPMAMALASGHPSDLRLCPPGESGIAVRVAGRIYRGGKWSYDLLPLADLSQRLSLDLSDRAPNLPQIGDIATVTFDDIWLLPEQSLPAEPMLQPSAFLPLPKEDLQCV